MTTGGAWLDRLRGQARSALPPEIWTWLQTGVDDPDRAVAAWGAYALRPHVLRDVTQVETATSLLGTPVACPLLVAPIGYQRLLHADGEGATARAAAAAGWTFVASTRSATRFEEFANTAWWLQVYVMRDRALTEHLVRRATDNGARALVLTGDTPYLGMQAPSGSGLGLADLHATNLDVPIADGATAQDPSATFDAIAWLRDLSGLPVLVKGVLRGDDARACVAAGAAGVIVSNHGLRQLPRAISTAAALPEVIDAVGADAQVLVDGGVRDGATALIALALGASGVLVGRPAMWGLAAGGEAGIRAVLTALRRELAAALGLAGIPCLADLPARDLVTYPPAGTATAE